MLTLLGFLFFGCARRDNGHTSCVQKSFLSKDSPRGREPRKINISVRGPPTKRWTAKFEKKVIRGWFCNPMKTKPLVIRGCKGNNHPCLWRLACQKLGYWLQITMRNFLWLPLGKSGSCLPERNYQPAGNNQRPARIDGRRGRLPEPNPVEDLRHEEKQHHIHTQQLAEVPPRHVHY